MLKQARMMRVTFSSTERGQPILQERFQMKRLSGVYFALNKKPLMRNVRGLFARSASIAVCLLVLALALRPRAEADASSMFGGPVMSVDIEAHGWKFAPAVSAGMLRGFYAEVLPDLARTGNLNILWFELTADGTWSAWGWDEGESSHNTIGWIRTHLSDESVFEDNPRVAASAPSEPEAWIEPIRLKRGLLESHPLQVILGEQPRSAQMFSTLEQVGWGVAPLVSVMSEEDVVASDSISMQQLLTAVAARMTGVR
jgi:hypothetical protein